jgi:chromosome segregation ATPase
VSVSRGQVAGSMRKTIDNLREANAGLVKQLAEVQAEIERLRVHEDASAQFLAERDAIRVELEKALAEVARLTAEISEYRIGVDFWRGRATKLEAEVSRLRAALRLKMDEYKQHDPGWCAACDSARAALAPEVK